MTLKECYAAMEGNYEDALLRLRSEKIVQKFVLKFLSDGSYALLCRAFETKDQEEAFRAAHTLKGICQNLSFTKLYRSSSLLTESLRSQWTPQTNQLFRQVEEDYLQTMSAIEQLQKAVTEHAL